LDGQPRLGEDRFRARIGPVLDQLRCDKPRRGLGRPQPELRIDLRGLRLGQRQRGLRGGIHLPERTEREGERRRVDPLRAQDQTVEPLQLRPQVHLLTRRHHVVIVAGVAVARGRQTRRRLRRGLRRQTGSDRFRPNQQMGCSRVGVVPIAIHSDSMRCRSSAVVPGQNSIVVA